MLPISKTINGTAVGSSAFVAFPDYFQNPFSLNYVVSIPTGNATYSMQYTLDRGTTILPTWNGSSDVVWSPLISAATATMTGSLTAPVTALRVQVDNATATGTVLVNLAQSVNSP